jgi:hypothetical protein
MHSAASALLPDETEPKTADRRLDDLELHDAILGDGVVLQRTPGRGFVLYTVDAGYVDEVGRFGSTAEAWRAVDALDDERRGPSSSRGRQGPAERLPGPLLTR